MRVLVPFLLLVALQLGTLPASAQTVRQFEIASADGTTITGQADLPATRTRAAVILVAGTGLFDRDAQFGRTGTPRDLIFADLAARMTERGLAIVRYDRRGIRYGATGAERIDAALAGAVTNETQRDDLAAVYRWTMARNGLRARCVIFFGHSEGMAHIGRLADTNAPAPRLIIGMGALLESPASVFHWQRTGRDAHSLRMMDADRDGRVTNEEVRANWRHTPSAVWERVEPYLSPTGAWEAADLDALPQQQEQLIYTPERAAILGQADTAPYPNAQTPMGSHAWIKSFFTDETAIAQHLGRWPIEMIFHYGDYDSQTNAGRQQAAAAPIADRARFIIHANRGHTLGEHVLYGPVDEAITDRIADEAAAAARGCR